MRARVARAPRARCVVPTSRRARCRAARHSELRSGTRSRFGPSAAPRRAVACRVDTTSPHDIPARGPEAPQHARRNRSCSSGHRSDRGDGRSPTGSSCSKTGRVVHRGNPDEDPCRPARALRGRSGGARLFRGVLSDGVLTLPSGHELAVSPRPCPTSVVDDCCPTHTVTLRLEARPRGQRRNVWK